MGDDKSNNHLFNCTQIDRICSVAWISQRLPERYNFIVSQGEIEDFLVLRKVEGLSKKWIGFIRKAITDYLNYINCKIDKKKSLEYFSKIHNELSTTFFRKKAYQIRKFLTYLNIDWAKDIRPPPEPSYLPKKVNIVDINNTLVYFKNNPYYKQIKALIYLGMTSGARAEELYQLSIKDIDLNNRVVYINHNPKNGQTTKTKISRVTFYTEQVKYILINYLNYYKTSKLKCLFNQSHISRLFRDAPIQVKDLRKYFSQEWDRQGGPTSIKKILMGHNLKGDIDLMHYNAQSEEDMKRIYDKVMSCSIII